MKDRKVDIWGWSETNVNWMPNLVSNTTFRGRKLFNNFKLITSSSDNPAGRIIKADTDTSGLRHWSYIKIAGKDQKQVTFVMAYRPFKQNKPGDATVNAQQHR
eukprot:14625367-Ditylum_brightwellii.AAC.1